MDLVYHSQMEIDIKGVKFKVELLTKSNYIKLHRDDSYAHLDKVRKTLTFRNDHIHKKICIHETTHAFLNACHLGSCSDISMEDLEEIFCEMLEEHIDDIKKVSNQILRFLKEEK